MTRRTWSYGVLTAAVVAGTVLMFAVPPAGLDTGLAGRAAAPSPLSARLPGPAALREATSERTPLDQPTVLRVIVPGSPRELSLRVSRAGGGPRLDVSARAASGAEIVRLPWSGRTIVRWAFGCAEVTVPAGGEATLDVREHGERSVAGRVTTRDETPVAGCVVRAWSPGGRSAGAPARVQPDGEFSGWVDRDALELYATGSGWQTLRPGRIDPGSDDASVSIVVARSGERFACLVSDPGGEPVAGAHVYWRADGRARDGQPRFGPQLAGVTDEAGRCVTGILDAWLPLTGRLVVSDGRHALWGEARSGRDLAGNVEHVVLAAANTIAGRVLDPGGRPVPRASVSLAGSAGVEIAPADRIITHTDAGGRFRLQRVGTGAHVLRGYKSDVGDGEVALNVRGDAAGVVVPLRAEPKYETRIGLVDGAIRAQWPEARVRARGPGEQRVQSMNRLGAVRLWLARDRETVLELITPDDVVRASERRHGRDLPDAGTILLFSGAENSRPVRFEWGELGPPAGVVARLRWAEDGERRVYSSVPAGTVAVPAGVVSVDWTWGDAPLDWPQERLTSAGPATVDVTARPVGAVQITTPRRGRARIRMHDERSARARTTVRVPGRLVLPAGRYWLAIDVAERLRHIREVAVHAARTTAVTLEAGTARLTIIATRRVAGEWLVAPRGATARSGALVRWSDDSTHGERLGEAWTVPGEYGVFELRGGEAHHIGDVRVAAAGTRARL